MPMSDKAIKNKHTREVKLRTSYLGEQGETLAADYLRSQGFKLVLANFKAPVGRNSKGAQITGEIDLIAIDQDTLCFIEVKTRRHGSSEKFGGPLTAVDLRKQRQISRTARVYRRIFGLYDHPIRYDVVTLIIDEENKPVIEHIKGFWNDAKFRKKGWLEDGPPDAP